MTGCKVIFKGIDPAKLAKASELAFYVAQAQIEADCNRYCRFDTGTLMKSVYSEIKDSKSMEISWNTPYARRVYFTGVARTDAGNPYAHILWADYASDLHKKEWALILGTAIAKGLNK